MFNRYKYEQLERWTAEVRRQTMRDMAQLRLERAHAEQPVSPRPAPIVSVVTWWQSLRQLVQAGGMAAVERAILSLVTPRTRPDQLLPDVTVPQR